MQLYRIVFNLIIIASIDAYIPNDMGNHINVNARPCQDFYSYSCGTWLRENKIQYDETHVVLPKKEIDIRIDQVVQEIINKKEPIITEFWKSCNAMDLITFQRNKPLQNDLNRIHETKTIKNLIELAGEFARTGGSVFVKFKIGPNPLKTNVNTLLLQPDITLPHSRYYSDQDVRKKYEKYIYDIMKLAYGSNEEISLGKRKRDSEQDPYKSLPQIVIKIEQQLMVLQTQMDKLTFPIKIEDAITSWPNIFRAYTSGMKLLKYENDKRILTYNSYIQQDLTIWGSIEYLNHIETILENLTIEELQIYIAFRMIHSRVQWLGQRFETAWYQFFRQTLKGQKRHLPRQRICRDRLRKYLSDIIGQHFYMDHQREGKLSQMIYYIRAAMWEHINKAKWLDDKMDPYVESLRTIMGESSNDLNEWSEKSEKDKALDKLSQLTTLIGQSHVRKSYPSTLTSDDYPANMYKIMSHSFDEEIKKVGQARNPDEWPVSSIEINAHYIPNRNAIVLPTGVLQPPLFHRRNVHPARNFGALGSMIGHELIHAFDAKGSLYDAQGNEFPWWDSEKSEYTEPAKCFETQYSEFEVDRKKVNGTLTRNEIIADNGGISLAWDAYQKYMTSVNPDTKGVTPEQGEKLFFISFAQSLCERFREKVSSGNPDVFLPRRARVNGAVMNNKYFAEVFECRGYTAMNPKDKCVLW